MKALRLSDYGGPEKLHLEDAELPRPDQGQVLVRIRAASVNPIDFKLASGSMKNYAPLKFPWIPGGDFAGIIEAVGSGGAAVSAGDEVFGSTPGGGSYAQFALTRSDMVAPKPRTLSFVEAASAPLACQTAWQALFEHADLQVGQTALIHGAAGGVGMFAVQLAHWKGAKVFATCSAVNVDFVRSLGADVVIDYKGTSFESVAKDVDVVLDLIGGETQRRSFAVLKPGGKLIASTTPPPQELAQQKNVQAIGMHMQASAQRLAEIARLIDNGELRTVVSKTYLLYEANRAWVDIMSGHTRGKIVLEIP
jgi:NADPH:quinone reductase-like Zn-dependent oxidoreductase